MFTIGEYSTKKPSKIEVIYVAETTDYGGGYFNIMLSAKTNKKTTEHFVYGPCYYAFTCAIKLEKYAHILQNKLREKDSNKSVYVIGHFATPYPRKITLLREYSLPGIFGIITRFQDLLEITFRHKYDNDFGEKLACYKRIYDEMDEEEFIENNSKSKSDSSKYHYYDDERIKEISYIKKNKSQLIFNKDAFLLAVSRYKEIFPRAKYSYHILDTSHQLNKIFITNKKKIMNLYIEPNEGEYTLYMTYYGSQNINKIDEIYEQFINAIASTTQK